MPALWEQGPAPLTAALVFGVGARHETFRTVGVTHLIEHLVMGTLPKSALDRDAEVDLNTTVFHATGPAGDVVDFVNRVCLGVSDLPFERIKREIGVLRAEEGVSEHPAVALSLRTRYGLQAQGLAGTTGPGPEKLTSEHVSEHARRYFTRDNAYLVLSGEPPEGLDLRLPGGSAVAMPSAQHVDLRLPGRVCGNHFPVVALSGIVSVPGSESSAAPITAAILRERVEDELRGRHGISYDIGFSGVPIRPGESMPVVWADGHHDKWQVVVDTLWTALTTLAHDGPTLAEMDHALALAVADLEDPRSIAGWLIYQASRALAGHEVRTRAQQLDIERALDAESVRACAGQLLETALLLVPDADIELADVPDITEDDLPGAEPVDGRVHRRKILALAPRDLAVHISNQGVSVTASGKTSRVQWSDIVGVASAPGLRGLIAADGRMLPVIAKYVRDGDELLARIDEHGGAAVFESDPEEILG